jgi:ABC-type antimicrobial peptide transport system permease subunit
MLERLYMFFFVLVIAIGFFLCFLLARGRKPEYAVMRLLGESSAKVTIKALLEQIVLCVCGILLGTLVLTIGGQESLNAVTCGIILACYTLGAAMAVLLTVRVNVMEILRDKE